MYNQKQKSKCVYAQSSNLFASARHYKFQTEVPSKARFLSKECTPFNLSCPIDLNWKSSKRRLLFVCQHVHTEDLKQGRLLTPESQTVLKNCYSYAKNLAKSSGNMPFDFSMAAINFNYFKTYHLSEAQKKTLNADMINSKRVIDLIIKLKPTHIFISGADANYHILKKYVDQPERKFGWVHDISIEGVPVKVCSSFDYIESISNKKIRKAFENDTDSSDDDADLQGAFALGFFSRCLSHLLIEKNPYAFRLKPKGIMIDTIKKFDALMIKLEKKKIVAIDTETKNLNRINNVLYTLQFAFSETQGYILPYKSVSTPFNKQELRYITKRLREYFLKGDPFNKESYFIMFNGKFDLTVLKQALGIRLIKKPVWDIRAGEFLLDENLKFIRPLSKVSTLKTKISYGDLAQTLCFYGEDFYYTSKFSKADRGDMENVDMSSQAFVDYSSMDVQSLIALHNAQIKRATDLVYIEAGRKHSYREDFTRLNLFQLSNNIHTFSTMEHRGCYLNRDHLIYLKKKNSPISKAIKESNEKFNSLPSCKKANKILLKEKGIVKSGLFGTPWMFNIDKPHHRQVLFFKVLGLKPTSIGKSGVPSIGKVFKKEYEEIEEVKLLEDYEKTKKLKTSFIVPFLRFLDNGDGNDSHLRPSYDFFPVVTGRSNCSRPSLQQIPHRTPAAKKFKESFSASFGGLIIKQDYSAHEIRGWSIVSKDFTLGSVFNIGRKLRRKLFLTGKKKYKKQIALKGDVHKLNQNFFFGTPITEITGEQRDGIKQIGFGAIYGKSDNSMARDLNKPLEFVQKLVKKYFARYPRASKWLAWAKTFSETHLFVSAPTGRRRFLFGYLTENNAVVAAMQRRAMNSPIQGMAADIGHTAARLFAIHYEKVLLDLDKIDNDCTLLPNDVETMVHDSMRTEALFENILINLHLFQWCATIGVTEYYEKYFNFKFSMIPEVDLEIGTNESKLYTWDWSLDSEYEDGDKGMSLKNCLVASIKDYKELYPNDTRSDKEIIDLIYGDWKDSKTKKYLDENYPILPHWEYKK